MKQFENIACQMLCLSNNNNKIVKSSKHNSKITNKTKKHVKTVSHVEFTLKVNNLVKDLGLKKAADLIKMSVNPSILGIPGEIRVKLRYTDHTTHTHTSGTSQLWYFRGNSVFDPDYTYTGHQPMGFDQFKAFFEYYRVISSKIEVKSSSLTADIPQVISVRPVREIIAPASWEDSVEASRSVYEQIATNGIPGTNLHNHASTKSLFEGQSQLDQDFGASVGANPTKVWYWEVQSQPANTGSTCIAALTCILEYDVVFSQKQVLGAS